MFASLLIVGTASLAKAQIAEVTHNTWTSGTAMPTPVSSSTAAVIKTAIYVVGGNSAAGFGGNGLVADVQIYIPVTNAWSTAAPFPTTIEAASSAVVKNVLYVFGGTTDALTPSNAVWAYNSKTKTWTGVAAMPTARWGSQAVVEKKTKIIYVIGGYDGKGNSLANVESYNPATNTWTEEAPMLIDRQQCRGRSGGNDHCGGRRVAIRRAGHGVHRGLRPSDQ